MRFMLFVQIVFRHEVIAAVKWWINVEYQTNLCIHSTKLKYLNLKITLMYITTFQFSNLKFSRSQDKWKCDLN